MPQIAYPAVFMRGGTSKGVFFRTDWLPADPIARDRILLRVIGSPDPYGQQIDGMGGATSSTSKVVLINRSDREDCDVDYRFGQVAIDQPVIDWSGNCGNLTSAVGLFAIAEGLVDAPANGIAVVKIWQANISSKIIAHVPMRDGQVIEEGDFELDGVTFPSAETKIEFLDPGAGDDVEGGSMFPTGNAIDTLSVPGVGDVEMTMINAGNPAIFIHASVLGLQGNELQKDVNSNLELLAKAEAIRANAAVRMGLAATVTEATEKRPHTPKLAFVAAPSAYVAVNGKHIDPTTLDLNARIFSMGKLHHAMTGTGAVAIAVASIIPGTVLNRLIPDSIGRQIHFGHPSGSLAVGAEAVEQDGVWTVSKAAMSRSARRLMMGHVLVPSDVA
ncbi:2-methylaconitate cis-trans isomerase PrpF [Pseudomonas aeruginosa]|uniref:2-methylaconitate cis-trans isomerase PrpF n=1 Tax=Pseudomonas aeruginosa TaxID=287 RepID=UPI0011507A49|nr:2-methylaconitate cis-trans isomerase PrpF [Pseudomonas aeruginosa]TQI33200.1 2-methylaconitate cis-trans isomerase PrpF [Pseudomonas aeruginosa]